MNKHPLQYEKEDLDEIMFKPLSIEIGPPNEDKIEESLEGQIVKCSLAANPPYLPVEINFQTINGEIRIINFFEIKHINLL